MHKMAPSVTIALVQTPLFWEDKGANLRMFENKIRTLNKGPEIVLLPEMFNTGFSMEPHALAEDMSGPTVQWMKSLAAEKRIVLAGSLIIEEEGNYYNRLIWMLPDGNFGCYDKRHLFAYAGEDRQYTPGSKRLITSVKGWKFNVQICYDLRFPVWARQSQPIVHSPADDSATTDPEYDVLVYLANWPRQRSHAWKTLLQARAIENQCYVAGVNRIGYDGNQVYYSGSSMIVDPMGEIVHNAAEAEEISICNLEQEKLIGARTRLPFLRDGDPFLIGV